MRLFLRILRVRLVFSLVLRDLRIRDIILGFRLGK